MTSHLGSIFCKGIEGEIGGVFEEECMRRMNKMCFIFNVPGSENDSMSNAKM